MKIPLLDLRAQHETIRDEVVGAVLDVVEQQRFILGAPVEELERALAAFSGCAHGVACASGTDALLLSLKTLDLEPEHEVITTPFTFFATAGAIHNAGGKPVFVDIDPKTYNLDLEQMREAITDRCRALLPVHLFGQMVPMEPLRTVARERGLVLIEDAAQAVGSRQRIDEDWVHAGQLGDLGTFSFFPSKNLGGWGDGGMIVTQDQARADRLKKLRTHGGIKMYYHDEVGFNSRLDALQAALLLKKLNHLEEWNAARRDRARRYDRGLADVAEVVVPWVDPINEHIYHQYTLRVEQRDRLREHLKQKGIGTGVYYPCPLHLQPCFSELGYRAGQFPESEKAAESVLSLPVYPELTPEAQDYVIEEIRSFYR